MNIIENNATYQLIFIQYPLNQLDSDINTVKKHVQSLSSTGQLWIRFKHEIYEEKFLPYHWDIIYNLVLKEKLILRNLIYVKIKKHKEKRLVQEQYETYAFFTKQRRDYYFNKDPARIPHRWVDHEFGNGFRKNGKSLYNKKGKDPSNVWVKEITKKDSPQVKRYDPLKINEVFKRIILVSTIPGDLILSINSKRFAQIALDLDRKTIYKRFPRWAATREPATKLNLTNTDGTTNTPIKNIHDAGTTTLENTILQFNSLNLHPNLTNKVAAIITSPPYYKRRDYGVKGQIGQEHTHQEYINTLEKVWANCHTYLIDGGIFSLNINAFIDPKTGSLQLTIRDMIKSFEKIGYTFIHQVIWHQLNSRRSLVANNFADAKEYLLFFSKGTPRKNIIKELNTWILRYPQIRGSATKLMKKSNGGHHELLIKHPARFPDEMIIDIIEASSEPGDLILDPFMGSGTVARAAKMTGRKWIGFELNPEFIEIAEKSLKT